MDWLHDERTNSWSILTTMLVKDYLDLVATAHDNRGSIKGQRDVLKTTSAKRIRDRLIGDIRDGTVLPPIVIGAISSDARAFDKYPAKECKTIDDLLDAKARREISIIDGMQRTAALKAAAEQNPEVQERTIRVELWLARSLAPLVYRMLVLNTGQVPWTLSRQLTVVYAPLLEEVRNRVPNIVKLLGVDQSSRRVAGGQFGEDSLAELYLAFSLRKTSFDTKEQISEEFSKLDFIDNLSDERFQSHFYDMLEVLAELDVQFSRYEGPEDGRIKKGRHIFDSQPARIGFAVAVSIHVLGRPGIERPAGERSDRMIALKKEAFDLTAKLANKPPEALAEFLRIDVLNEILDIRVGQVGRYERAVYLDAFKVLIEEHFDVPTMEPCWRAN